MNEYRWPDIHLGLAHSFEAEFTEQMVKDFSAISGDINPLHTDPDYARSKGFPGAVLFGLISASLYSKLAGVYLPGKYSLLQGIDIHFNAPVFLGDRLVVRGRVAFMTEAYHRFEVKATIRKTDGTLVSKATIRVGFYA